MKTERIHVRRFRDSDLEAVRSLMTNAEVMKFTRFRTPQTEEKIQDCLHQWVHKNEEPLGVWGVWSSNGETFIGWVMLKRTDETCDSPELGFMLCEEVWGQGYATEVASTLLKYAFVDLKLKHVFAVADAANKASIQVLKKIGMSVCEKEPKEENAVYFSMVPDSYW